MTEYTSQTLVDWDQILLGRFVVEWKELVATHMKTLPKKKRKRAISDTSWVSSIMEILFNFAQIIWIKRNKDRHGRDTTEQEQILLQRVALQTEELCSMK